MTTIVTRAGKGSPLTNTEVDTNFTNLNDAKIETLTSTDTSVTITGTGSSRDLSVPINPDVVSGPASATDNAIARYDATTGKLIQNSVVLVGDTGSVTGVNALTAESLTVNNNATLGSSNTDTLDVNARITTDLEPNANNAKDIGTSGRNWRDGFFGRTVSTVNIEITGTTSFDGSQGTSGQVLTSAGTGATPTWTTPTTGTVTSVDASAGTGISISGGPITSSGSLTITNTAPDQTVVLTAGTGISTSGTYPSFTVTNSAPDQTVALTASTGISVTGTYPNFTITNTAPSSGGTVTSISGTGSYGGLTLTGTVTSTGSLTLGGTPTGTWPISVSGNAATATSATSATSATTASTANALNSANSYTAVSFISTSDERLKTNWAGLSLDFVARLSDVKYGTFERISNGTRDVGVSAQSLQKLIPEAVVEGEDGFLAVNYGGAALVAAIELAKQVQELRAEIAALKAKVGE